MTKRLLTCLHIAALTLLSACVTEDVPDNNTAGNFEALWRTLDEHYCFFPEKAAAYGLDWDSLHTAYRQKLSPSMTSEQLFDVCARMIRELRDGHVNLTASHDMARYWDWEENYPLNHSDSLERIYLGTDYRITSGLKYRMLDDNVGYVRCASFDVAFGSGNLNEVFRHLALADGLIVDLRSNGGGLLTSAQKLAECFVNTKTLAGYICHKTGRGHSDFSKPEAIYLDPAKGLRWQKPVVVITNHSCFSAANSFVMMMKGLPQATILGNKTGGGAGLPFSSELPNGWSVRFSACPMYNRDMQLTEEGIEPDIVANLAADDFARGRDTMIEAARAILRANKPQN